MILKLHPVFLSGPWSPHFLETRLLFNVIFAHNNKYIHCPIHAVIFDYSYKG